MAATPARREPEQQPVPADAMTALAPDATAEKPTLRFITCGSVDDGKSTLIGRLLWEQNLIFDDQIRALERDTVKHGTTGEAIDFALLVDGLEAERQQGITIDVAYRYFKTKRRSFIVADTPGHEQYTRNMATGASGADLAILLVDARKGLLTQTHRHATIVSLLGIKNVVLAVNKFDLVGYDKEIFDKIVADFKRFAEKLAFTDVTSIPLSALAGDNLSLKSDRTPWYEGKALVEHLEDVDVVDTRAEKPFRMPVQAIARPNLDFRGFVGTIAAGRIAPGDEVCVASSGRISKVARIVTYDGDLPSAEAGDAVTLTLADEIDIARGDVLSRPNARPQLGEQFAANLIWMSDEPMRFGRSYLMKLATQTVPVTVGALSYRLDINTFSQDEAATLRLNEVGLATITTTKPIAFDPYDENAALGAFILIDRETNQTIAAGMIAEGLRRATNVFKQKYAVSRTDRARLKHQRPGVLWFTGLSGSGKSTIADMVEARLNANGYHTVILDGDNVRHGLNKDLGFSQHDRLENIRRVAEVARLMTDAGLIVICSFISPFRAEREMARATLPVDEFLEIYVDVPLEVCITRDVKGLYRRALAGEIKDFTGVDQAYEPPEAPELVIGRDNETVEQSSSKVLATLRKHGFIDRLDDLADWSI
ncbi:Sulfate adenylyltransferase subunit 1 / Adenylyl-sulfate kinase [Beijerinckiaceae bacterium RH AL1]|nr:Sulfate adenylyltransferase subunit 1 / Adenylyl-sulfate kinase [Beijerinckiaceae bacterium RH CH11]VVB45864.1 Sulfate adenylyltransferase subunit 1 / Adenylyl-sulfate kinase [Beijerinckiaceae bacterium RH AL8]VVC55041.1 Sulfate adenylyltransferase subunit 1 / Adenylyl-sulfate kinase [Beijerinckiaceae bacterium RH AL1]